MNFSFLKYISILLATVAICSCSTSSRVRYFTIDNSLGNKCIENRAQAVPLKILKIEIPEYLDSQSMIFRVSKNEIVKTKNNKWVDVLSEVLQESLSSNFKDNLKSNISGVECNKDCYELAIKVNDFSGTYEGYADISLSWSLFNNSKVECSGDISKREQFKEDGYDAMVLALDKAWFDALEDLHNKVNSCLNK